MLFIKTLILQFGMRKLKIWRIGLMLLEECYTFLIKSVLSLGTNPKRL